jgi:hypothetical protein
MAQAFFSRYFLPGLPVAHNGGVSDNVMAMCPKCGNGNAVHSVQELADLTQAQLGRVNAAMQGQPQPGQSGPGQGPPGQGWMAEPVAGPPPGAGGYQQPYGGVGGYGNNRPYMGGNIPDSIGDAVGDAIAGAAVGAAGRFLADRLGKKMQQAQQAYAQKVPAAMAQAQQRAQEQQAIAQKYPELRFCQTDQVIFLAGGNRYLPWATVGNDFSMQHADQLVAQLRG